MFETVKCTRTVTHKKSGLTFEENKRYRFTQMSGGRINIYVDKFNFVSITNPRTFNKYFSNF